jgi:glycosyltransferase involved in cell wall biosynthesis
VGNSLGSSKLTGSLGEICATPKEILNRLTKTHGPPVSVVVMTFNEERNIEPCLQSVAGWADEVIVVDSFSTDRTEQIARTYTSNFVQHAYESHPAQWQWVLDNLPLQNDWIFAVDADFRVSEKLKAALTDQLPNLASTVQGIYVRHKQIFRGRALEYGGLYPRYWLRLFRRNAGFIDQADLVDVHFYVKGDSIKLEYDVIEDNLKESNLDFWVSKQIRFAQRAGIEEIERRGSDEPSPVPPSLFGTPDQRTLWLKGKWYRLPLYWRSIAYFLYRYIFRLGFLDGKEGFLYHFTQALVFRVMVDARIEELREDVGRRTIMLSQENGEGASNSGR